MSEMAAAPSRLRSALAAGLLLLAGGALGALFMRPSREPIAKPHHELADTATVLLAVRHLARLESVSFHLEKLIDLKDRQSHLFGLVQADDAILLVAAGDVVAGLDLAKLGADDLQVDPVARRVALTLPEAEVLSVRLDNQRTFVHSRATDLLAKRGLALESEARRYAERAIANAALEAGIIERARTGAAHTLTVLVRALGYQQVEVRWQKQ